MLRLAFLLIIAVAAMLLSWQIVDHRSRHGQVEWFGRARSTTSALFALLMLVAADRDRAAAAALGHVPDGCAGAASAKPAQRARVRRGQEALALGLIAAEAGEFEDARRHADKAEDLIDEPRLAMLLQARAAEVGGDTAGAERAYSGMLQHEDTEVLGRKGLMAAALKRGDRTAARAHAEARAESLENRGLAVPIRVRSRRAGRRLGSGDRNARARRQAQADRRQSRQSAAAPC